MLTTISHRAMAAEFAVMLAPSDAHLMDVALGALESLDQIEQALTIYREDSEISRVNALAGKEPVRVSDSVFELVSRSLEWSRVSNGAFDITAGPLIDTWGFTRRRGRKPSDEEIRRVMKVTGYGLVTLDARDRSVFLERPGMCLNLGAIGKGYALDTLAERLADRGLRNYLIHGGGSSILARGNQSSDVSGWAVGISHPIKPSLRLAGLRLHDQSLSTSGSGKQFFHFRGRRYGHVIDPRTGYPAGEWLALTVITDNATDAEALSTSYYLSSEEALEAELIDEQGHAVSGTPVVIAMKEDERQDSVNIVTFGNIDWVDPPRSAPSP